ncbi:LysE family translocator [Breoghania sp.]|uniref:LysE family translocator n=1 Tax=Breoghania sp. TaxID=2065378 RepID=UPI00261316F9|nr:LysE family translocator [Breoghania sp.]MDJ0932765.1 LysE family translocator [Breoghania sp.]
MDFLPDTTVIAAFTATAIVLTLTPGPDMTLFLSRALTQGRAAGFAAMADANTGLIVHTLLAAYGLSALLAASATAFLVVKIAGAAYLLWLAFQTLRHGSALSLEKKQQERKASLASTWATGLGINLLNPKIVLFFVTFLPQSVSAHNENARGQLIFLGLYFTVLALPFTLTMIMAAEKFSSALKRSPRIMRVMD